MQESISILMEKVKTILYGNEVTAYLFGSVCLNDFKPGWSDIDILILTENEIMPEQAEELVYLRQNLLEEYRENPYFRSFEGGILRCGDFVKNHGGRAVYWGTSGQRITDNYYFDVFSRMELMDSGILLSGKDIRDRLCYPSYDEMIEAVRGHYQAIRQYGAKTGRNLYSCGWILDIARCLYTLKERKIIAKTQAGCWAIENGLVSNTEVMERTIKIRKNPLLYKEDSEVLDWLESLGPMVQEFADVLENKLAEALEGITVQD